MTRIKTGIVGGTGYTGVELLRLLSTHPNADLVAISSRQSTGEPVASMFPNLRDHVDLNFSAPDDPALKGCDVVYFATPHATSMNQVPELLEAGVKVIDLSADFRLKDAELWQQWYGEPHAAPEYLAEAVYGLPEINRDTIRSARLVACAGCYPTAIQLGFLPLLEQGLIDPAHLIADAKSGVSGAGRTAKVAGLLAEASDNFAAYAVSGHRHLPEIRQGLEQVSGSGIGLVFVPHLVPMIRGIQATLYGRLNSPAEDLQSLYEQRYAGEPFVDVLLQGSSPQTRSVRGSNMCRLAVERPGGGDTVVVLAVIDNLVKGASGQAVQCMNLMFGLPETTGLGHVALLP